MSEFFTDIRDIPDQSAKKIPTGLSDLDFLLDGSLPQPGLTIISGYPGTGKTDLALNIALHTVINTKAKTGFVSLDTPQPSLSQRLKKCAPHAPFSIKLAFLPGIEISTLCQQAENQSLESGLDLLIIDRVEMIGQKSSLSTYAKRLKELAHKLDLSLIGITSTITTPTFLSKNPLFAAADLVLHLDRGDLRYSEEEWESLFPLRPYPRGIVDIQASKNRLGPTGIVTVLHFAQTGRFINLNVA